MVDERSAGAVVFFTNNEGNREYLLLHHTSGHWDFPKGNMEDGESELQTASREIQEETGIVELVFLEGFRKKIEYKYKRDRKLIQKEVIFFVASTRFRDVALSDEHVGFAWKSYEDALDNLTFRNAKNLLKDAKQFIDSKTT